MVRVRRPLADRFWEYVDKNGPTQAHCPELEQCWVWTGGLDGKGYGEIHDYDSAGKRKELRAHRVSWELHFGPPKQSILHRCDYRPCIRPSHLFDGSSKENTADMFAKQRDWRSRNPDRQPSGERHGRAKLRVSDVARLRSDPTIRALPGTAAAALFNVSVTTVNAIRRGENWKGVA